MSIICAFTLKIKLKPLVNDEQDEAIDKVETAADVMEIRLD